MRPSSGIEKESLTGVSLRRNEGSVQQQEQDQDEQQQDRDWANNNSSSSLHSLLRQGRRHVLEQQQQQQQQQLPLPSSAEAIQAALSRLPYLTISDATTTQGSNEPSLARMAEERPPSLTSLGNFSQSTLGTDSSTSSWFSSSAYNDSWQQASNSSSSLGVSTGALEHSALPHQTTTLSPLPPRSPTNRRRGPLRRTPGAQSPTPPEQQEEQPPSQ